MQLDKVDVVDEPMVLRLLKVDRAIQRTVKAAEKDFEKGGRGYAKEFFSIPCKARHELAGKKMYAAIDVIETAIRSVPHVHGGFASIWSHPSRVFPGEYSITLYINT